MKISACLLFLAVVATAMAEPLALDRLESPILLKGDARTAYRDPAAVYHEGVFYLFFTKVVVEENDAIFMYTAMSRSTDLRQWSEPQTLTPRDSRLNYSSPGNAIRHGKEWILCLQTYPRPDLKWKPDGVLTYANADARLFIMRSRDLEHWSEPELLHVLGPDVPREKMGRMIDPFLVRDLHEPDIWWCFFKREGKIGYSRSRDLVHWEYRGSAATGENPCVIPHKGKYRLYYSPENGVYCKESDDLVHWREVGDCLRLGQDDWLWTQGRLTAGFVLDLKKTESVGKYLMFFHGSLGPRRGERPMNFDINCNIGLAWSDDLETWQWPVPPPPASR